MTHREQRQRSGRQIRAYLLASGQTTRALGSSGRTTHEIGMALGRSQSWALRNVANAEGVVARESVRVGERVRGGVRGPHRYRVTVYRIEAGG